MRVLALAVVVVVLLVALRIALGGDTVDLAGPDECEATLDHVRDLCRGEIRARQAAEGALSSCQDELAYCR